MILKIGNNHATRPLHQLVVCGSATISTCLSRRSCISQDSSIVGNRGVVSDAVCFAFLAFFRTATNPEFVTRTVSTLPSWTAARKSEYETCLAAKGRLPKLT